MFQVSKVMTVTYRLTVCLNSVKEEKGTSCRTGKAVTGEDFSLQSGCTEKHWAGDSITGTRLWFKCSFSTCRKSTANQTLVLFSFWSKEKTSSAQHYQTLLTKKQREYQQSLEKCQQSHSHQFTEQQQRIQMVIFSFVFYLCIMNLFILRNIKCAATKG